MPTQIKHVTAPADDEHTDWARILQLCGTYVELVRGDRCELRSIRATLLANFGEESQNRYGFTIKDEGSTHMMLMSVLRGLTENLD